jgi:hypothetical protein
MGPIIEQPPADDFYSPELIRFSAAGFAMVSAACALLGFAIVNSAGCFDGNCGGEEGWGFGVFILLMWAAAQIVVGIVAVAGFFYLVISQRTHRTAITFSSVGLLATGVILLVTISGLVSGS